MKRKIFTGLLLAGVAMIMSCSTHPGSEFSGNEIAENKILQQDDGTIALKIDKAEFYNDLVNPSTNTAEWNVVVSKTGRYDVWLSSATKDTNDLNFKNSVLLSIRDNRLETMPVVDKVVRNSGDVSRPYYQADSFMGSLYIQDTGMCNIQVISDKIIPPGVVVANPSGESQTKILSVYLKPAKRKQN